MNDYTVLIVDSNRKERDATVSALDSYGYVTASSGSFTQAVDMLERQTFRAVILCMELPNGDSWTLLSHVRQAFPEMVIIATSDDHHFRQAVRALGDGADDYLGEKWAFSELSARLQVRLRDKMARTPVVRSEQIRVGNVCIDPGEKTVYVGDEPMKLSLTEYAVLYCLASKLGKFVSKDQLLEAAWKGAGDARKTKYAVYRIRDALEEAGATVGILNQRGWGYCLREGFVKDSPSGASIELPGRSAAHTMATRPR